ncbi:sensor histidine kinase [Stagnihabitans tardus]|uniref:Two-component sensor histidine kinase n=1 Tax=Stagnihabitans tardus TaxID=2699202 RepID=A0AAE4YB81_9RHOB|nr:histidine kinase [Stagnihabitans tardus]NBZ88487.1 two-component sensor histidine kinase [Stagnihabitans tardus]
MSLTDDTRNWWSDLSLAGQFALAGGLVMALATGLVGFWVSGRIEGAVVRNAANTTALYMESFIEPLAQDMANAEALTPASEAAIAELLRGTTLGKRVVSFKLWGAGQRVVASTDAAVVGRSFPDEGDVVEAWKGEVVASFNHLDDEENAAERALNLPLLQIYTPIRERGSGRVIAVAEFYEVATQLQTDLVKARLSSWMAVLMVMAGIFGTLFAIVLRGSRIIQAQLEALAEMASRNVGLRIKVQGAAARFSALNDQALRQIGADLHDGPAQLMGFAALRLDSLRKGADERGQREIDGIQKAIREAISEIRNISRGVSLPEIEKRDMGEVIRGLVDAHAARTGTEVALSLELGPEMPIAVKICLGRLVQEGLTNAFRHGGGVGQEVRVSETDGALVAQVLDAGPGLAAGIGDDLYGLGLAGLAGRVESLGGELSLTPRLDGRKGSELRMVLDLRSVE